MNSVVRAVLVSLFLALAPESTLAAEQEPSNLRSWEVARRDCRTAYSREELTLFGNGTLRLRLVTGEKDEMRLAELNPDQVQAYIRRLVDEDLSEVPEGRDEFLGAMMERCAVYLDLPGRDKQRFFFGRFDSLPLGLSRLLAIIDDVQQEAVDLAPEGGLPRDYFPEPGDILERTDGHRFTVVALTSDRMGVELAGIDDPLTIFVALASLRQTFVGLAERRRFP